MSQRRSYSEDKTGFMQWQVFFSDDGFATQRTALDHTFLDRHHAMVVAIALGQAFNAGAAFASKFPEQERAHWGDESDTLTP